MPNKVHYRTQFAEIISVGHDACRVIDNNNQEVTTAFHLNPTKIIPTQEKHEFHHTFIPTQLCQFAFVNKFIRPFQLYIYLKSVGSGKIKITDDIKIEIGKEIGLGSKRAVSNNLHLLLARNWIGFCKKSRYYYIRSFDRVKKIEGFKRQTAAEFHFKDIKKMKAFLIAAVITKLINQQKRRERELERKKGRSIPSSCDRQLYFPVANLALSKILNIAISTAFEHKKIAQKAGFIKVKKEFVRCKLSDGKFVKATYKNHAKAANSKIAHKIRVRNNYLWIQQPDKILSKIRLKRKGKKSKHTRRV